MTTLSQETVTKAREALAGHLNSWRHKHGLSVGEANQILAMHMQKASGGKAKRKPPPPPPRPAAGAPRNSEEERLAQMREGNARAAREA